MLLALFALRAWRFCGNNLGGLGVATAVDYDSAQSAEPVDQDSEPVLVRRDSLRVAHGSSASFFVCFWCVGEDRPGAHGVNSLSG